MADRPILTPAARDLLGEALRNGKAPTKGRRAAVTELVERGLITVNRGKASLTAAGRFAAGKDGAS